MKVAYANIDALCQACCQRSGMRCSTSNMALFNPLQNRTWARG